MTFYRSDWPLSENLHALPVRVYVNISTERVCLCEFVCFLAIVKNNDRYLVDGKPILTTNERISMLVVASYT